MRPSRRHVHQFPSKPAGEALGAEALSKALYPMGDIGLG